MMADISEVANVLGVTVARGTAESYVLLSEGLCVLESLEGRNREETFDASCTRKSVLRSVRRHTGQIFRCPIV